ncbi:MAG TPA: polymer-forming cytoskeletal protein [bacterium (Candidatus Stahlbacteria)]|nr:polymer-forming cytoskeletal protein [Candidatus Stahlbacteria bacterium]
MFRRRKREKVMPIKEKIETLLAEGTSLSGNIECRGSMRIDGKIEGKINCSERVIIGKTAEVKADIEAVEIIIAGRVRGNIKAKEKVEIQSKGYLVGDIYTRNLVIAEGVFFQGKCVMEEKEGKPRIKEKPLVKANEEVVKEGANSL